MTKRVFLKKGLFMVAILTAVLSLAGCLKEAENNGGGSGFSITSIEGTWIWNGNKSDESIVITSNSFTVTQYNSTTNIVHFSGEIVKTLTKGIYVAIIGKNFEGKYKGYYFKNINPNNSIEVGRYTNETYNSLENAENEILTAPDFIFDQCNFKTYLYQ